MDQITETMVRGLLPRRREDGHKGTFGKVYVLGGAVGYTGAPVYAGEAAVRTGSGLVFVGVPEEVYPIVAARCGVSMAHPVPQRHEELLERGGIYADMWKAQKQWYQKKWAQKREVNSHE